MLDGLTSSWFVVGGRADPQVVGAELVDQLECLPGVPRVAVLAVDDVNALVDVSRAHADLIAVFVCQLAIEALHLDDVRSMLQRSHAGVLVVPFAQLVRIASVAPHFASWVGNRVFGVQEDRYLSDDARVARIGALQKHFGTSDEEFVAAVERGTLTLEPEHAEWLVLIGREDLLKGEP